MDTPADARPCPYEAGQKPGSRPLVSGELGRLLNPRAGTCSFPFASSGGLRGVMGGCGGVRRAVWVSSPPLRSPPKLWAAGTRGPRGPAPRRSHTRQTRTSLAPRALANSAPPFSLLGPQRAGWPLVPSVHSSASCLRCASCALTPGRCEAGRSRAEAGVCPQDLPPSGVLLALFGRAHSAGHDLGKS